MPRVDALESKALELGIDRALKALPLPRAPFDLLPRVLAAAQEWSARPWYARAWFTWPLGWQIASAVTLLLVAAAGTLAQPAAGGAISSWAQSVPGLETYAAYGARSIDVSKGLVVAANAFQVVWSALMVPLTIVFFAVTAAMCLLCAAGALALGRVAFGRSVQS